MRTFLLAAVAALILTGTSFGQTLNSSIVLGDGTGDEFVDVLDVQISVNEALGRVATRTADVNFDGEVNLLDIQVIIVISLARTPAEGAQQVIDGWEGNNQMRVLPRAARVLATNSTTVIGFRPAIAVNWFGSLVIPHDAAAAMLDAPPYWYAYQDGLTPKRGNRVDGVLIRGTTWMIHQPPEMVATGAYGFIPVSVPVNSVQVPTSGSSIAADCMLLLDDFVAGFLGAVPTISYVNLYNRQATTHGEVFWYEADGSQHFGPAP